MQTQRQMHDSIDILNYSLLFFIVIYALAQIMSKITEPLNLIFMLVVFLFLWSQNHSIHQQIKIPYNFILILIILYITVKAIAVAYCYVDQYNYCVQPSLCVYAAVFFIWIFIMIYEVLLCWRAYQRIKLYQLVSQEQGQNQEVFQWQ